MCISCRMFYATTSDICFIFRQVHNLLPFPFPCPKEILSTIVFYLNVQCIEYTFRITILLHIKKKIKSYTFLLVFKIAESLQCILNVRQNQPPELFYKKSCPERFRNILRKITVLESLYNKVSDLQACNFIKKRLQYRCFQVNIAKF